MDAGQTDRCLCYKMLGSVVSGHVVYPNLDPADPNIGHTARSDAGRRGAHTARARGRYQGMASRVDAVALAPPGAPLRVGAPASPSLARRRAWNVLGDRIVKVSVIYCFSLVCTAIIQASPSAFSADDVADINGIS